MSLRLGMGVLQGAPLPVEGVEGQAGLDTPPPPPGAGGTIL